MDSKATEHEDNGQAQEESRTRRKSSSNFFDREVIAMGLHGECRTKNEIVREDSWVLFRGSP